MSTANNSEAYNILLTVLGAFRNGIVYGTKVRAPHSLVVHAIWSSASWPVVFRKMVQMTAQHASNLAIAASVFKIGMEVLKRLASNDGKTNLAWHPAVMGGVGGYFVWGEANPVNVQVNLYMMSRVLSGLVTLLMESRGRKPSDAAPPQQQSQQGTQQEQQHQKEQTSPSSSSSSSSLEKFFYGPRGYRVFAFVIWALALHIFYETPNALQPAMSGALRYIYKDSAEHGGSFQKAMLGF